MLLLLPFKDEMFLCYIGTQCVPRSKHSPLRLCKTYLAYLLIRHLIVQLMHKNYKILRLLK